MYSPTSNFKISPTQDIYCQDTGESVWVVEDPVRELKVPSMVMEYLPNRFHQPPVAIRLGNGNWKLLRIPYTPEPLTRGVEKVDPLPAPEIPWSYEI